MRKLFMGNKCRVCYFIHCCDKMPVKNNLRDTGFILANSLRREADLHGRKETVRDLRSQHIYNQEQSGGGRDRKRERRRKKREGEEKRGRERG